MTRINASAAVNPINLVALITLSMPKLAIEERTLLDQLNCYMDLLRATRPFTTMLLPDRSAAAMVAHVESLGMLTRETEGFGDVLSHGPVHRRAHDLVPQQHRPRAGAARAGCLSDPGPPPPRPARGAAAHGGHGVPLHCRRVADAGERRCGERWLGHMVQAAC
jgi:hypothetical protein